jgi:glycosyltransferase involved in cell wall biosynthesis
MYTPLVSVIIPTYNRKELVKETVQSVLEQDYPKIEVVIVMIDQLMVPKKN